jgi:hypothetical protein
MPCSRRGWGRAPGSANCGHDDHSAALAQHFGAAQNGDSYELQYALCTFRYLLFDAPGPLEDTTAKSQIETLDGKPWAGTKKTAASELRCRLNRHAHAAFAGPSLTGRPDGLTA